MKCSIRKTYLCVFRLHLKCSYDGWFRHSFPLHFLQSAQYRSQSPGASLSAQIRERCSSISHMLERDLGSVDKRTPNGSERRQQQYRGSDRRANATVVRNTSCPVDTHTFTHNFRTSKPESLTTISHITGYQRQGMLGNERRQLYSNTHTHTNRTHSMRAQIIN